jgi:hypothetical protein
MNNYIQKRTVTLMQTLETSSFIEKNAKIFTVTDKPVTANDYAQRKLLSNSDFIADIMPVIVGVDDKDREWRKIASKYFYEISISVPLVKGKTLDISLEYDLTSTTHKKKIEALPKTFKTADALAEYVDKNIEEIDKHYYATPVNYVDYFAYVFTYYHSRVANNIDDVTKSNKIQFYMITKEDIEQRKKKAYSTAKTVRKYLTLLDEKPALFENLCIVLNIKGETDLDKYANIEVFAKASPTEFIGIIQDKQLKDKAMINGYVNAGLLFKIPNSGVLVDMNDRSLIIGSNMGEAISFFNNPTNKDYIDTIASQYKTMKNSK